MITPEYIDVHSHISFPDYDQDREAVIKRMKEKNIWAIDVGTNFENSKKASENAAANQNVFASAGLHPTDGESEDFVTAAYKKLFENPKVVAVGECGLDYYHSPENKISKIKSKNYKKRQKKIFEMQVELALELDKPLMIHCRNAYADLLEILRSYSAMYGPKLRGNMHFFAGGQEEAKKFLALGFTLSFTGVITFARDYDEVVKNVPIDMILAETDSPFVAPVPYRGKRNEPIYIKQIVQKISEIRSISYEEMAKTTTENAIQLFNLR